MIDIKTLTYLSCLLFAFFPSAVLTSCSEPIIPSTGWRIYQSTVTNDDLSCYPSNDPSANSRCKLITVAVTRSSTYSFQGKADISAYVCFYNCACTTSIPDVTFILKDITPSQYGFCLNVSLQANFPYTFSVRAPVGKLDLPFEVYVFDPDATIRFNDYNLPLVNIVTSTTSTTTTTTTTTSTTATTTTTTSTTTTTTTAACYPPEIGLFPDGSSLESPKQFRRIQDFYISSDIKVVCAASSSYRIEWKIYHCSSSCSFDPIQINNTRINTKISELFIPGNTFDHGIYKFELKVIMTYSSKYSQLASVYVEITPSMITANLVLYGTSIIATGYLKDLTFNPGNYSIDPNSETSRLNPADWNYTYYCRLYDLFNPDNNEGFEPIDASDNKCFLNESSYIYHGISNISKSALTILANSLLPNQTYQFMVNMTFFKTPSFQATGFVTVKVKHTKSQLIVIGCVIYTMCSASHEYQYVNPSTQVALFSSCSDMNGCASLMSIKWNIYQGSQNSSTHTVQWTEFSRMKLSYDKLFGINTSNFTATSQFFEDNKHIQYWRFESVYTFTMENSSSAINFRINDPPKNGRCSIEPLNGTTTTLFNIECSDWFDTDGVQFYSVYVWTHDSSTRLMLASTGARRFPVLLPAGDTNTSSLHIRIEIQDTFDAVTSFDLPSVIVEPDTRQVNELVDIAERLILQENDLLEKFNLSDNDVRQNTIGQILTSFSQLINNMNTQELKKAIANGVPAAAIAISPLGSTIDQPSNTSINTSALDDYKQYINRYAQAREHFLKLLPDSDHKNSHIIKMHASTLAQITQATNQLTRDTCLSVSNKCHQLATELAKRIIKIPREDAELATTHIFQCAMNVLTAINAPLQDRGEILDLDFMRANKFPDDYDTDLEFEWSNENLFANGDDFSLKTIEKNRNIYYQKQAAKIIGDQVSEIRSIITNVLNIHLNINQNTTMNTPSVFISMESVSNESLTQMNKTIGNAQIRVPSNLTQAINDTEKVFVRSIMQPLASLGNSQSNAFTNLSTSISFSLLDKNGHDLPVNTNLDEPFEFIIPREPNSISSLVNWTYISLLNGTNQSFHLHSINLIRNNQLDISIHFEIRPINQNLAYWFIYKFDGQPQVNSSKSNVDGWTLLCPGNLTNDSFYRYFIDNRYTSNHESVIFGLRELNVTEISYYCASTSAKMSLPIFADVPFNFSFDYEIRTYTSGCYYLDSNNQWKSDGLLVGHLTNLEQTHCYSTHLTTFAGGFLALPVTINFQYVFANADFMQNKTIYITVICVSICYIILIIFARHRDKKDIDKYGITFLPDNRKNDRYYYQLIVFTGHRKDAGTESKVHFVLGGDNDETNIRTLTDPDRKILQRAGIDIFIMAVPQSLGPLNYLRIWHDNSGRNRSASWFLKYIIVRDLQTMTKTHFICQRWFAVEKDDGLIERLLPVAGVYEKQQLAYVVSKQAHQSMSEGHLWFSIFSRPPTSTFTRVQRCTCCFALLFTAMFFNILYYEQVEEAKNSNTNTGLSVGPFYFSREQVSIGMVIELLTFFPSLLLVQFFRRIRFREKKVSPKENLLYNKYRNKEKHMKITFPWWCLYLAYILSILLIVTSCFFIIARGIELGNLKTQKWLTSILIGFFQSICFTQPVKVICIGILFSIFLRNMSRDDDEDDDDDINDLDVISNQVQLYSNKNEKQIMNYSCGRVHRLNKAQVEEARVRRERDIRMWSIIREMLICLCFLYLIYTISYSTRNMNAFHQVKHLRRLFLKPGHPQYDYTKIISINDYWTWLEGSFVKKLRAQPTYKDNRTSSYHLKGFINDTTNRFIGWATMRQLRVNSESCRVQSTVQHLNLTCTHDYSLFNEEKRDFQPGWTDAKPPNPYNPSIANAFQYKTNKQLDTYVYVGQYATYGSGGYVYELRGSHFALRNNLSQLHQLKWLDNKTRAVIIQCTLYNPNVQLFTSVTLLIELLATGSIIPSARFEPFSFQDLTSMFHLIIAFIYMLFIIYFMIIKIRSLIHLKFSYFRQFWCYIEWSIIACSWTGVGIYIWRYHELTRIEDLFRETKGFTYINLQFATYVNELLTFLLGFCCFFATIKLFRFSRFNRRLSLFINTLQYAIKDLLLFTIVFSIVFIAFLILFHLLFISKIFSCSNLLQTAEMLFEMILFKFDASEIRNAEIFLGPFCFTLFIVFIVFICMTMFISIISDSFRNVRKRNQTIYNEDYEMLGYIWKTFLRSTGIQKPEEWEIQEERDRYMRSEYYDPIERFPEKVEQLFGALERMNIIEQHEVSQEEISVSTNRNRRRQNINLKYDWTD